MRLCSRDQRPVRAGNQTRGNAAYQSPASRVWATLRLLSVACGSGCQYRGSAPTWLPVAVVDSCACQVGHDRDVLVAAVDAVSDDVRQGGCDRTQSTTVISSRSASTCPKSACPAWWLRSPLHVLSHTTSSVVSARRSAPSIARCMCAAVGRWPMWMSLRPLLHDPDVWIDRLLQFFHRLVAALDDAEDGRFAGECSAGPGVHVDVGEPARAES